MSQTIRTNPRSPDKSRSASDVQDLLLRVEAKIASRGLGALSAGDLRVLESVASGVAVRQSGPGFLGRTAALRTRARAASYLSLHGTDANFESLTAHLPDQMREAWRQLMQEVLAYLRQEEELVTSHRGKYVAVCQGKLVASARTADKALSEAYRICGHVPVYVHKAGAPTETVRAPAPREI